MGGNTFMLEPCELCGGSGKVTGSNCYLCNGIGKVYMDSLKIEMCRNSKED